MTQAPSPFFEGTSFQFAWDNTSLEALMTCPRKYQLSILEGWRSKTPSAALDFGRLYHAGLELVDVALHQGLSLDEALRKAIRQLLEATTKRVVSIEGVKFEVSNTEVDPGHKVELHFWQSMDSKRTREILIRSIIYYYAQYSPDPMKTLTLPNGQPALELSFTFTLDMPKDIPSPILWCGHIDKFVTFGDYTMVLERKTTTTELGEKYFANYLMSNQITGYSAAGKVVFKTKVHGAVIDAAQLLVSGTRFQRSQQLRTDAQLDEWTADTMAWVRLAYGFAQANYWPMNKASCGNYGGCVYRQICSKDPSSRPGLLSTHFTRRYWNPLEVRTPGELAA